MIISILEAAQEAYMKSQTELAIARAKNARACSYTQYLPGETVYVYRQPRERKRKHAMTEESHEGRKPTWVGPGVILAVELPSLWVSMKGELWKVSVEQCRHATSEEQMAKELLMGELEALREELGRDTQKRTYKDMTEEPGPVEDEESVDVSERGLEWIPGERPSQRQRVLRPEEVPVPEDGGESVLSYQPSLEGEEEGENTNEMPVAANTSEASSNLQPTVGEPEPWPSPEPVMHPMAANANPSETAEVVMRNERLDGNLPGTGPYEAARRIHRLRPEEENRPYVNSREEGLSSSAWFSLQDGRWQPECDAWEVVDKNMVIRHHSEPRTMLCNPAKIKGALMPRRLKHRQTFMILESGEVETQHDNWFKNRRKVRPTSKAWTGFTVFSSCVVDPAVFASSKPRGQGEVFEHEIKEEEWGAWKETDRAEWDKVTMTDAVRVLSLQESREVRADLESRNQLDRILPSRMVRRWKPSEQPGAPSTRKSRWCIRGDRDPDLLSLQRYAPTLNTTSFGVLLQVAASMRYRASVGDLKNAFCQSSPLKRDNGKLCASQPKAGIEGLHPEQIVEIVAGCYGLGDAPAHWRRTLKEAIIGLGYKESVLDPTVYMLHSQGKLHGAIAVEIDDLFSFGSELHYKQMDLLRQSFVFGKFEMVDESPCGVGFNGRRVRQMPDRSFSIDMEKFIGERLDPVSLAKGRKANPKALANDSEIAQLRAVIGALAWAAKEGRPDAAAAASLGAGSFPKPTIQDVIDVNKTVRVIKSNPALSIKVRAIPLENLAWGVVSDASFANAYGGNSQGAYGIIAFHEDLQRGTRVPCSLISWKSGRIHKVVNSTLAAETQSLSKGLGELCWVVSIFNELTRTKFDLAKWEEELQQNKMLAITKDESDSELKECLAIVDAKALFDHLSRESVGPSQDKRTSLEIQVVRQLMNSIKGKVRWVPHPQMIVDGLTKKNGNLEAPYQLLLTGEYQIVAEAESLETKRLERESLGYNRR